VALCLRQCCLIIKVSGRIDTRGQCDKVFFKPFAIAMKKLAFPMKGFIPGLLSGGDKLNARQKFHT
jgi:hypothetical protein